MNKKLIILLILVLAVIVLYLFARDPFVSGKYDFQREEILELFNKHEEKFEYVVAVLKGLDNTAFEVRMTRGKHEVVFYKKGEPIDIGYQKDELFEKYLKILMGDCKLRIINVSSDITFGANYPIIYSEKVLYASDSGRTGPIKGNWYYHVQTFD